MKIVTEYTTNDYFMYRHSNREIWERRRPPFFLFVCLTEAQRKWVHADLLWNPDPWVELVQGLNQKDVLPLLTLFYKHSNSSQLKWGIFQVQCICLNPKNELILPASKIVWLQNRLWLFSQAILLLVQTFNLSSIKILYSALMILSLLSSCWF